VKAKPNLFPVALQNQETPASLNNKNVTGDTIFSISVLISQGKQLERRFWKQLKRRRSGANTVLSSPPKVAA
jgi:hypothetical protein